MTVRRLNAQEDGKDLEENQNTRGNPSKCGSVNAILLFLTASPYTLRDAVGVLQLL